jgi:hypothetical protein
MAATVSLAGIVAPQGLWPVFGRRVSFVVVLLVWIGSFIALDSLVSKSPLTQLISLDPPGAIDTEIWIPLRERYFLEFEFSRQGHSFEKLKQLIGDWGPPETDGVPVAISWSLTATETKEVVAQGAAITKGVVGWGEEVHRRVDTIRVEPGRYRFHARILNPVPQLASIPTRLVLWNSIKTTDTWQSGVLFWGTLFTVWIVTPVTMHELKLSPWAPALSLGDDEKFTSPPSQVVLTTTPEHTWDPQGFRVIAANGVAPTVHTFSYWVRHADHAKVTW